MAFKLAASNCWIWLSAGVSVGISVGGGALVAVISTGASVGAMTTGVASSASTLP
jgi:hypothetical protein